jgi:hypothetical protein
VAGEADTELAAGLAAPTEPAEVLSVLEGPCPPPQPGTCASARIRIEGGESEGSEASLALAARLAPASGEPGDEHAHHH